MVAWWVCELDFEQDSGSKVTLVTIVSMVTFVAAAQSAKWPMKYNSLKCTNKMPFWQSTDNSKINDSKTVKMTHKVWLVQDSQLSITRAKEITDKSYISSLWFTICDTIRNDRIDQDRTRQRICQFFVNYMLVDFKLIFWISFNRSSNYFYFLTYFVL